MLLEGQGCANLKQMLPCHNRTIDGRQCLPVCSVHSGVTPLQDRRFHFGQKFAPVRSAWKTEWSIRCLGRTQLGGNALLRGSSG